MIFFTKHKVVPLGFFQILTKIQTEPFSGLTFVFFFANSKILEFNLLLHILSEMCKKNHFMN